MTTDELNTIVAAVVAELEKSGVDFDYKIETPLDTDNVFVIRGTAPNYQGVTVTWKGLLDIITAQATQAKNDAETAKNAADTILSQVTTKESNVSTMKSEVSEMKVSVESTKSQVEGMKNAVETTKGQVETMKTSIETTKEEVETMKTSVETSKSQVETMKTSIETTKSEVETLKSESETAKETATQKAAETTQAKGDVESMKASVEKTVADFNALAEEKKLEVQGVYQNDLNELKGDLDTERNARVEADTDHSTRIQKNRYEIDNLKAKAEGKLYRTETVEAEAYALDVPSSVAPYAEVQKIGGKSIVWNQLFNFVNYNKTSDNITINVSNNRIKIIGTALQDNYFCIYSQFSVKSGHKYICLKNIIKGDSSSFLIQGYSTNQVFEANTSTINIGYSYKSGVTYDSEYIVSLIDLTQMFGVGNEPTLEECQKIFSADYYPFDAGTIKSFPVKRVKSVGRNLFSPENFEIGDINVDTGANTSFINVVRCKEYIPVRPNSMYYFKTIYQLKMRYYDNNKNYIGASDKNGLLNASNGTRLMLDNCFYIRFSINGITSIADNAICINVSDSLDGTFTPYMESTIDLSSVTSDLKSAGSVHDEWNNGNKIKRVGERAYTSGDESDSSVMTDGTTTYYPLDTPTEETVPEIDNYINVEGGGTLTFESDDAVHMPVPSTTRFVVDLTSTTEETI